MVYAWRDFRQDRQCTHNIAHLCNNCCSGKAITITHTETDCTLGYPKCSAHEPYCHMWPAWLYNNFPHYLIKAQFFKKVTEHEMCVLILSTIFFWNISHSKKKWAKCDQKLYWSSCKVPVTCQIFMKLKFSPQILKKYLNINFHENPSCRSWVVLCGLADRQAWRS